MDRGEIAREHHAFWMLVKGCRDHPVGRVYLAIQAALAYDRERVDVEWLMGEMMARGQQSERRVGECLGAEGLAYFHWLYAVELVEAGEEDCHGYQFRRRQDGKQIVALLRTASNPQSLHFKQTYERQKRVLERQRGKFLLGYQMTRRASGVPNIRS